MYETEIGRTKGKKKDKSTKKTKVGYLNTLDQYLEENQTKGLIKI